MNEVFPLGHVSVEMMSREISAQTREVFLETLWSLERWTPGSKGLGGFPPLGDDVLGPTSGSILGLKGYICCKVRLRECIRPYETPSDI